MPFDRTASLTAALAVPPTQGVNEKPPVFFMHPDDVIVVGESEFNGAASMKHPLYDKRVKLPIDRDLSRDLGENGVGVNIVGVVIDDPRKDAAEGSKVIAVVDGRQRTRALRHLYANAVEGADLPLLPVEVHAAMDEDAAIDLSVRLNLKRQDEVTSGIAHKIALLTERGWSKEKISDSFGLHSKSVENYVTINMLRPGILDLLDDGEINIPFVFDLWKRSEIKKGETETKESQDAFAVEFKAWRKANKNAGARERNRALRAWADTGNSFVVTDDDVTDATRPDGDDGSNDGDGDSNDGDTGSASNARDPLAGGFTPNASDLRTLVVSDAFRGLGSAAKAALLWLVGSADDVSFQTFGTALVAARVEAEAKATADAEAKAADDARKAEDKAVDKAAKAKAKAEREAAKVNKVTEAKAAVKVAKAALTKATKAHGTADAEADGAEEAAKDAEGSEEAGTTKAAAVAARRAATKAGKLVGTAQKKVDAAERKLTAAQKKAAPVEAPVDASDDDADDSSDDADDSSNDADLFANE